MRAKSNDVSDLGKATFPTNKPTQSAVKEKSSGSALETPSTASGKAALSVGYISTATTDCTEGKIDSAPAYTELKSGEKRDRGSY